MQAVGGKGGVRDDITPLQRVIYTSLARKVLCTPIVLKLLNWPLAGWPSTRPGPSKSPGGLNNCDEHRRAAAGRKTLAGSGDYELRYKLGFYIIE
jgi:hypothetical protein